ncbi:unnamed protein product [Tilletia laevis]|uniref:mRNA cap guanine-N(7) methyltransferase n=3 Tax=Tilletia TaxID=13289 RepID=A0A8X7MW35_9BASI|nr:hypothetical protein CF336_g3532 [Tilletia laevis]KAE8251571.1 hypothetical protein A4X06_0g2625 [Tilletia controversa]KAE8261948.1 hypothetical protein A4X03_0g2838 [Tilletia caries]KAE8204552.1 hypothetical protein CF335_g2614 [Tilletia laevis]CAD6888775.1 unnamed protein product [Tilletia caries]
MSGFNDILNPIRRSSGGRGSVGSTSGAESHRQHPHPSQASLSPTHSQDDASYRNRRSLDMSIDIPPPISSSSSRPSPGMSRTSISNLLGDSVESPRSRPILSGTSSPSDESRRSLHPPWPASASSASGAPMSAPPLERGGSGSGGGGGGGGGGAGYGMSFLLNNGTPGAVVERKSSRSSSHGGPPFSSAASLVPPTPPMLMTSERTASAPAAPVPASPSGSISESSTTGGTVGGPKGTFVGRLKRFFVRKDAGGSASGSGGVGPSLSPQLQPAVPPHQAVASPSSRVAYIQSPSGGSMMALPPTPGTPHSSAEHSSYPLPGSHHQQQHPSGGYMSASGASSTDHSRRAPVGYPDGVEFSPTLVAVGNGHNHNHPYQQHLQPGSQHPHTPAYHLQQQAHHAQHLSHQRASLSPTTLIQSLPPGHATQQQHYAPSELGPGRPGPPPPMPAAASGSDMSPPPVPASLTRAGGPAATKRSASSNSLLVPEHGGHETAAGRKRARAGRDHSTSSTPASSRPTSPVDGLSATMAMTASSATTTTGGANVGPASAAEEGPAPVSTSIPAEFRDPKVNVKKLPPPKFAKPNAVSPGAGGAGSAQATAGGIGGALAAPTPAADGILTPRNPGAPKDWMSAGISSAAVGLATGLDGGAAAAAASAAATAALKAREQQEKERASSSAVEDGHGERLSTGNKRRKSSSTSVSAAIAKRADATEDTGGAGASAGGTSNLSAAAAARARIAKRCESSGGGIVAAPPASNDGGGGGNGSTMEGVESDAPVAYAGATMTLVPPETNPYAFVPKERTASSSSSVSRPRLLSRGNTSGSGSGSGATLSLAQEPVAKASPIPYAPKRRKFAMGITRKPIYANEIEAIKMGHRNPLRWKYEEEVAGLVQPGTDAKGVGSASASAPAVASRTGGGKVDMGVASASGSGSGSASRNAPLPGRPGPVGSSSASSDQAGGGGGPPKRKWDVQNGAGGAPATAEREPASKKRSGGGPAPAGGSMFKGPDNNEVSEHYNFRPDVGVLARKDSKIYPLKKFNNWAKNMLIHRFSRDKCRVLDMGCGKGGDLTKWSRARASELVMIDIAGVSVGQAEKRYQEQRYRFVAEFYTFDCFSRALSDVVPMATLAPKFDNVTLQFCMHYGWESVSKARCLLENVARYLKPGGYFIGTIPDAGNLLQRLGALEGEDNLTFGNNFYHATFEQKKRQPPFGNKYWFFLEDAVDDVPEYVVDWEQFEGLAREAGLRLVYKRTFEQMYYDAATAHMTPHAQKADWEAKEDLQRMGVPMPRYDGDKPMDPALWEAVCLYLGFAFERVD